MKQMLSSLGALVGELVAAGVFALAQIVQFVVLLYLGYLKVYSPLAGAPGARDGAGLLLVAAVIFVGAAVLAAILGWMEATVVRWFLPDREPAD